MTGDDGQIPYERLGAKGPVGPLTLPCSGVSDGPQGVAAIVAFAFGDLMRAPRKVGKPLRRQLEGSYSARRGPYRIIYDVDDVANQIEILRIDHRSDVYRNG